MKELLEAKKVRELSKVGQLNWRGFCAENNLGSVFAEDDFVEIGQPSIGNLMDYCQQKDIPYTITEKDDPLEKLWPLVKKDLEES